jgi:DNA-binding PadR family transcriptional regulator
VTWRFAPRTATSLRSPCSHSYSPGHATGMRCIEVITRHIDFVTGLPRSVYHAVDRLRRNELIRVLGTDRPSSRPERTILAITDAGLADLEGRVRRLLRHPEPDARLFAAALSYVDCLSTSEASAALKLRRDRLERSAADTRADLEQAAQDDMTISRARLEYEVARLNAERVWVSRFIDSLDRGHLA